MSRQGGFTLVELMIVVAIIGVLAVVAGTSFHKYGAAGRKAEAISMIGELKAKEEAFRAENAMYLPTDTAETNLYPALGSCTEPCAKSLPLRNTWSGAGAPLVNWNSLGVNPSRAQLYCGYVVIAGPAGSWTSTTPTSTAGPIGQGAVGGTAGTPPTTPWYYVMAVCDNDRTQTANTTFVAMSNNSAMVTLNEGK
jgi:prepilin-type N-terminal cleavage/methylation domain-containing protein